MWENRKKHRAKEDALHDGTVFAGMAAGTAGRKKPDRRVLRAAQAGRKAQRRTEAGRSRALSRLSERGTSGLRAGALRPRLAPGQRDRPGGRSGAEDQPSGDRDQRAPGEHVFSGRSAALPAGGGLGGRGMYCPNPSGGRRIFWLASALPGAEGGTLQLSAGVQRGLRPDGRLERLAQRAGNGRAPDGL